MGHIRRYWVTFSCNNPLIGSDPIPLLPSTAAFTFTSSRCLCVSRKHWRRECPPLQINGHYHDNSDGNSSRRMLIMATVAGSQTNSLILPQGQANMSTPGFYIRERENFQSFISTANIQTVAL